MWEAMTDSQMRDHNRFGATANTDGGSNSLTPSLYFCPYSG